MQDKTIEILKDFMKVNYGHMKLTHLLNKYKINKVTYNNYRKMFINDKNYAVDPRFIYSKLELQNDKSLRDYIKDEATDLSPKQVIHEFEKYTQANKDALFLKGTSTLYDSDGNVKMQWIKTDLNKEVFLESTRKAIEELCKKLPESKPVELLDRYKTVDCFKDTMTFIPIPDLHLGLEIEKEKVSHNFDWNTDIAIKYYTEAMDYLFAISNATQELVLTDLGDLMHMPDNTNRTPKSGHILNVSGSYEKNLFKLYELMINTINKALTKYEHIYFYSVPGNHNMDISLSIKSILKHHFRNNKRVHISLNKYNNIFYHHFGKNLLSFTHGDEIKKNKIETVVMADNLDIINTCKYFDAYFGHLHTNKQEQVGMINAITLKNIIPCDSWASSVGYRNNDVGFMQSFIYHKEYGRIVNYTYRPKLEELIKSQDYL